MMVTYQFIQFFGLMGRKRNAIPNRLHHRPSGQDRILWNGQTIYLGKHGSPEADAKYRQIVRSILETGEPFPPAGGATVAELGRRFMVHTRKSFPVTSSEPTAYQRAIDLMTEAIGDMPADQVTPAKFTAMRDRWTEMNSVRTVNKHHNQCLAAFRWGVTMELVPASVWHALEAVQRLKPKRSQARDPRDVHGVAWKDVEAIREHVRPQVWTMIRVHWLTGMRSGELLGMTPRQVVDWVYRPTKHKNVWRGHVREIPIGPKCRRILAPILKKKGPDDRVFPGYTSASYGRAISRACVKAGSPHWHPHQIRHSFAQRVRDTIGLDAAQAALGHKNARVTEIYAAKSSGLAKRVMDELG